MKIASFFQTIMEYNVSSWMEWILKGFRNLGYGILGYKIKEMNTSAGFT